jgi:hypothetical protein
MSEEDIQRIEDELNAVEKDENGNPKSSDESTPKRRRGFLFEDFLKQPLPVEGGNSGNNDVQQQSDSGQQSEPPKNLPANLESIEKF